MSVISVSRKLKPIGAWEVEIKLHKIRNDLAPCSSKQRRNSKMSGLVAPKRTHLSQNSSISTEFQIKLDALLLFRTVLDLGLGSRALTIVS